jgi:polar amino acid transport system substrate-binding protein
MTDHLNTPNLSKRALLTGAALAGAGIAATTGGIREAMAQVLESGIDPKSVLAKVKKGETLKIGYGQQALWFYKDPKTNEFRGVYKELCDALGRDLEMKVEYQEVVMANSTVALRKGDYDLFGSSAVYTVPRALAVNYVGPLWSKGSLAMIHKDNASKFKTAADLNSPDVTFSVNAGSSEESRLPQLFPKAKFIATAGQVAMAAEPVRTGRATVFVTGDSDALVLAKRNASWAHLIDRENPFDKRPNTWMVRHGDEPWKNFLDMWATFQTVNGETQRLYDKYLAELA